MVGNTKDILYLRDGDRQEEVPLRAEWGITREAPLPASAVPCNPTWRALFPDGVPHLGPVRVYLAVPFYPEDDAMVEEAATQPLVMEQTLVYLDRLAGTRGEPKPRRTALIHNWDAVIVECLDSVHGADCTVLFTRPEFAVRQAQRTWDHAAAAGRLATLRRVSFLPADPHRETAYARPHDLIYNWIPFASYKHRTECEREVGAVALALAAGGCAILVGPPWLREACLQASLRPLASDRVVETAGVRMHQAIMPKTRVNPESTLFLVQKA